MSVFEGRCLGKTTDFQNAFVNYDLFYNNETILLKVESHHILNEFCKFSCISLVYKAEKNNDFKKHMILSDIPLSSHPTATLTWEAKASLKHRFFMLLDFSPP